jgi:hypothetical protein
LYFLDLVAVDFDNSPSLVPRAIPDSEQVLDIYKDAEARRTQRLHQRRELVQKEMATHPEEFEKVLDTDQSELEDHK